MWRNPLSVFNKKAFESFCLWAYEQGASDISITSDDHLAIKLNGLMVDASTVKYSYSDIASLLRNIYQPTAPDELMSGIALDFGYSILLDNDDLIRFRVSATAGRGEISDRGISIILRTIPNIPPHVDELNVPNDIRSLLDNKFGLVLVTGPTGSGKTTLVASLLRLAGEKFQKHIVTFEAPIEFSLRNMPNQIAKIVQTEVYRHLKDFSAAISNLLRRAPDIVLIGEARDKETINGTVRAALTGHLVFTTVHTNSVEQTISRMADEFPKEYYRSICASIIDSLRGIVHQRLIPKRGGGRIAIMSYLIFTDKIRTSIATKLIGSDDITQEVRNALEKFGWPLMSDVNSKFEAGLIELTEYVSLVVELGNQADLDTLPKRIKSMGERDIIDTETVNLWLAQLEENNG